MYLAHQKSYLDEVVWKSVTLLMDNLAPFNNLQILTMQHLLRTIDMTVLRVKVQDESCLIQSPKLL